MGTFKIKVGDQPQKLARGTFNGIHKESMFLPYLPNEEEFRDFSAALANFTIYHFHDTSKEARIKTRWDVYDGARLKHDAGNLGAFLLGLHDRYPQPQPQGQRRPAGCRQDRP